MRGLKHEVVELDEIKTYVAPYVGAWIETYRFKFYLFVLFVAPYVGAWIETS